jgi:hypothetical protein
MKIIFFLFILIVIVNCDDNKLNECLAKKEVEDNECNNIKINDTIKCCYVKFSLINEDFQFCTPILNSMKDIKSYKKMLQEANNIKILCNAKLINYYYYLTLFLYLILI